MALLPAVPRRALLCTALLVSGCSDSTGVGRLAEVHIQVSAPTAAAIAGLTVEATAADMDTLYGNLVHAGDDLWSGTMEVPVGPERKFVIRAYEETRGMVTHRGENTTDVGEQGTAISIILSRLTGSVGVDGTIGSFSIAITPSSATMSLSGTITTTATAAITDQDANSVTGSVVWAIKNPGIASIAPTDNSVEITGLIEGTTRLVATFKGFVTSATITVEP